MMVPEAPSAAASVGVAQPAVMAPTTMPKISTSGSPCPRNRNKRTTPSGPASAPRLVHQERHPADHAFGAGLDRGVRRKRGIERGARDDVAHEQRAQDQARHD